MKHAEGICGKEKEDGEIYLYLLLHVNTDTINPENQVKQDKDN